MAPVALNGRRLGTVRKVNDVTTNYLENEWPALADGIAKSAAAGISDASRNAGAIATQWGGRRETIESGTRRKPAENRVAFTLSEAAGNLPKRRQRSADVGHIDDRSALRRRCWNQQK